MYRAPLNSGFTAELQLQTLYVLNNAGRIVSTREPDPRPGPLFSLIRTETSCAWAVRADVPEEHANELDILARQERPCSEFRVAPEHADRYVSLVGGRIESGPAFTFPAHVSQASDVVLVEDLGLLEDNFRGWTADEIPGRSPVLAVMEGRHAISVCFCARRTDAAAEAGVETATAFRGRGLAGRVTAAWASAIRASGRFPIYSTSWANAASLAVARKTGLTACASDWSLQD